MTDNRSHRVFQRFAGAVMLLAGPTLIGCGTADDGPPKYPVRGRVLVDGRPAEAVRVRFQGLAGPYEGNDGSPVGVTDAEGFFDLSTDGRADGAVAGPHVVTFSWPEMNGPSPDRLGGQYADPNGSPYRVTVAEGENELEPFRLESTQEAARPGDGRGFDEDLPGPL